MVDFNESQIQEVWKMGVSIEAYDKNEYRQDYRDTPFCVAANRIN